MSRRILLADDSVTIQKVIELTFMDDDFEVEAVGNGDEALSLLAAKPFDFVIADVHMPGANGYEVSRRAKELRPGIPVLLLVGTFEPFDEAQARASNANSHLKKPFDSQELLQRVHELLGPAAVAPVAAAPAPAPVMAAPAPAPVLADPAPVAAPAAPEPAATHLQADWPGFELEAEPEPEVPALPEAVTPPPDVRPFTLDEPSMHASADDEPVAAHEEIPLATEYHLPEAPVEHLPASGNGAGAPLADADVDRIARRVVELLGDKVIRDIAWEVIPDLAEVVIKDRLRELESQVE
jgi:CheY-like chemotaxis protein